MDSHGKLADRQKVVDSAHLTLRQKPHIRIGLELHFQRLCEVFKIVCAEAWVLLNHTFTFPIKDNGKVAIFLILT